MSMDETDAAQMSKVVLGIEQIVPHLNQDQWKPVELTADQWADLESVLKRPLAAEQRDAASEAIGYFIHTLRLKDRIPTPRQYALQISARLGEIIDTAENLLTQITPLGDKPADTTVISAKAAQQLLGGRMATWHAAADASRTTEADDEVMAPEDHVRHLIVTSYPHVHNHAHTTLVELVRSLHALRKGIASIPHHKSGADGNYELNLFLVDLLRVAQAAGDDLRLASHDIRDCWMADTVKANPAYRFVERVVALILESAEALVDGLSLPAEEAE